ncbi:MAG: cyclodeaminase/cyclohydrolase family protein [Gemmatimonadetes bacterium]|nr:cyclodeaminase/cyclohydrolase family protein [Gemmatimonadota bacterium]
MTTWTDEDMAAFLKVVDAGDDQTGGGTASAVAGAMAAGLAGMVARLSIGRDGMEPEPYYREIDAEAQVLTGSLLRGGREDSEAFGAVMRAFTLPKCTDEEKAARSAAIQEGMVGAAKVPLENAERCAAVLGLVTRLQGRSNQNAASDLAVAAALARTALEGCLANVAINVESIKDSQTAAGLAERAAALRAALDQGEAVDG